VTPEVAGAKWRHSQEAYLPNRRAIVGLSLANLACMSIITLYQAGIVKRIPEPRRLGFDSARVTGSAQAYALFETPDSVLGLASYAATLAIAACGAPGRHKARPFLPIILFGKTLLDTVVAAKLLVDERRRYKTWCLWCVISALCAAMTAAVAAPEALGATEHLKD